MAEGFRTETSTIVILHGELSGPVLHPPLTLPWPVVLPLNGDLAHTHSRLLLRQSVLFQVSEINLLKCPGEPCVSNYCTKDAIKMEQVHRGCACNCKLGSVLMCMPIEKLY